MIGYFVLGTLAAFGCFCAVWAAFGWLLPGLEGCVLVCMGTPKREILARSKWLRGMGLLNIPLLVVADAGTEAVPETEICSREELIHRLEWERNRFHGTGNGDHTGHHQCRGISEL